MEKLAKNFIDKIVLELNKMAFDEQDSRFSRDTSPTEFEIIVLDAVKRVINDDENYSIDYTEGGHAFPDIVVNFNNDMKLGIEVKSSTAAKASETSWTILGNSILGTTRVDVNDLYIVFIKVGNNGCFIKSARYEDSVSDVAVTHSPRYKLDLSQDPSESFFSRSGISYEEMTSSTDPIGLVTDYFREQGQTAWWIAESTPAIIKNWNELTQNEKKIIQAKSLILFPEIIYSNSPDKYKRVSKWLVANYSVVDSSLRDRFSAGGRVDLAVGDSYFEKLPRIYETLKSLFSIFTYEMKNMPLEDLEEYWEYPEYPVSSKDTFTNRLNHWSNSLINELNRQKKYNEATFIKSLFSEINRP